ncbi:MAG: galactose mutarotase [Caulobacter sp.]|nr:galactose mutarotase [Caulobacter sp.]
MRIAKLAGAAILLTLAAPIAGQAATLSRAPFGQTPSGEAVEAFTLTNAHGVSATVITYGATLQSLVAPGRDGVKADIVLGFSDAGAYARNASYFGSTVGRVANRIGKGRFTLDGKTYQLALNDHGLAALHGGATGFDKVVWKVLDTKSNASSASVTLGYVSPDGDQGYPGAVTATATYALDEQNQLTVSYGATTDKPTIVNMSNHALFNLAGEGSSEGAMGNILTLAADGYTPVDAELIPTGEIRSVAGTAFDFRKPTAVGDRIRDARDPQLVIGRGYDHNYVLNGKAGALRLAARLSDPKSGRTLEILSDQPGIQFYAGNFIDGTLVSKSGKIYRQGDGIALEPQHFPDAPNKPAFAPIRLNPGETYSNRMVFKLSVAK